MRKLFVFATCLMSSIASWSMMGMTRITVTRGIDWWLLALVCLVGFALVVISAAELFKPRAGWVYLILGVIFFGFVAYAINTIYGIIGLIALVLSLGGRFPAGLLVLMCVFNSGWGFKQERTPMIMQESYKPKQDNLFLFMLKTVCNFDLPEITTKTWGKTFDTPKRYEFAGGGAMKISINTDFKVREVTQNSYGSTYKVEASKPVSLGYGIFQVKFKQATVEVSNNFQVKFLDIDARGNKWFCDFLRNNTFDGRP